MSTHTRELGQRDQPTEKNVFLHYFARFFKIGYLCSQFCHYVPYNEKTIVDKERPEHAHSRGAGAMAVGFRNYNS